MFRALMTKGAASIILMVLALRGGSASAAPLDDVPASFAVAGRQLVASLHGVGAQVYACKADPDGVLGWSFREPIATLLDGDKTVGRHFAGPNWDVADGSGVTAKPQASHPGATTDDTPWLALQVVAHRGAGPLSEAGLVLRLNTVGGTLAGPCSTAGALKAVPYQADYLFLR